MKEKGKNKHRGEMLQSAVRKSNITVTMLSKRMGISRGTYYNHVMEADLPFETLEKYGKILKYDFTADFPQMHKYILEEPIEVYGTPVNFEQALNQRNYYKEKYFQLLEKYNTLIEEKIQREK